MLTISFLVLKLTDSLLLAWSWVVVALVIDVLISKDVRQRLERAYEQGFEDGRRGEFPISEQEEDDFEVFESIENDRSNL